LFRKFFLTHITIFIILLIGVEGYASYPSTISRTINVGGAPTSLAVANGYLFVANSFDLTVTVINLSTYLVDDTIDIGYKPHHLIASIDGSKVYASAFDDDNIVVISAIDLTVSKTITEVGDGPLAMCLSPSGDKLYVACKEGDQVTIISTSSDSKISEIKDVGDAPVYAATTFLDDYLYVTLEAESSVVKIDLIKNEVTSTKIAVGTSPQGIALTPNGNFFYTANLDSDSVSGISVSSDRVVKTVGSAGDGAKEVAILRNGEYALITNSNSDNVTVLSILDNLVVDTITVGSSPNGILASDDDKYVYVTDKGSNTVSILEDLTSIPIDSVSKQYLTGSDTSTITWHTTESGTYQIEIGGDGIKGSGDILLNGAATAGNTIETDITAATDLISGDGTYRIYIYLTVSGGTEHSNFTTLVLDTTAPAAPSGLTTGFGDATLFLNWNESLESDLEGYKVYFGTSPATYGTPVYIAVSDSFTLTGLTNGTTYYIAISAYDIAGNESPLSAEMSETPDKILSLSEINGEKGCFIAETSYDEKGIGIFNKIINSMIGIFTE
jgi:YVTN family beta-propeller protein